MPCCIFEVGTICSRWAKNDDYLHAGPRDKDELYDLRSDPLEMKNLALEKGNQPQVEDLKRRLAAQMKELEDPAVISG